MKKFKQTILFIYLILLSIFAIPFIFAGTIGLLFLSEIDETNQKMQKMNEDYPENE